MVRVSKNALPLMDTVLAKVFHGEGFINSMSAISLLVFPKWSLEQLGVATPSLELQGMCQWFASLCAILAWIGLRSELISTNVEALLIGDLIWIAVGYPFIVQFGQWTPSSIFAVGITAFLAIARSTYLFRHYIANTPKKKKALAAASLRAKSPASRTRSKSNYVEK